MEKPMSKDQQNRMVREVMDVMTTKRRVGSVSLWSLDLLLCACLTHVLVNHWSLVSLHWCLLSLLAFHILYQIAFRSRAPRTARSLQFDPESSRFDALRRNKLANNTCQVPNERYPKGWYRLAASDDLLFGAQKPLSVSALGREFVLWRGDDGVRVLDAFCPHLGAHLGDGTVGANGCLACPFHGWQIGSGGRVESVPYIGEQQQPVSVRSRAYAARELFGSVLAWFDPDAGDCGGEAAPDYEPLVPASLTDGSTYYGGVTELRFRQRFSEMAENSADLYHFNTIHAPFPLPGLSRVLAMRHRIELAFVDGKPASTHRCFFRENATPMLFDRVPVSTEQTTSIVFDGPATMYFVLTLPVLGRIVFVKTILPVGPFDLRTEDLWFTDNSMPRFIGTMLAIVARNALEQDRRIWERKVFSTKPGLVKGDINFSRHRRWFNQFLTTQSTSSSSSSSPISCSSSSSLEW
jgi:nitrite reductase/ring-hydroxylating ferredoxin subunit